MNIRSFFSNIFSDATDFTTSVDDHSRDHLSIGTDTTPIGQDVGFWSNLFESATSLIDPIFSSHDSSTDMFGNGITEPSWDDGISSPCSDHSTSSDWTNAWGTACDYQIPAEADYEFPSHDFTSTTFPDSSDDTWSSDYSSSSSFDNSWD